MERSNHSQSGLVYRTTTWNIPGGRSEAADRFSPAALRAVGLGGAFLLVLAAVLCTWTATLPSKTELGPPNQSLEFALVMILMVLLSPASSKPHFCTLVLPGFCLARAALVQPRQRLVWAFLVAAITCGLISNKDLVGPRIYDVVLWYGSVTWGAILLFAGVCWVLLRRERTRDALTAAAPLPVPEIRQAA